MQTVLGLIIHRETASKEGVKYLHKCNHTISYNAIRKQNEAWARMVSNKPYCASSFRKGVTTHSTIDNNDGKQETIDGTGTTHDTNITMFQLPTDDELLLPTIKEEDETPQTLLDSTEEENTVKPFHIGKLVSPPLIKADQCDDKDYELELCLKRDIAWSAAGSLIADSDTEQNYDPLGSWTAFMREVTQSSPIKFVQEYQPVLPHAPEYPICKKYLDGIIDIINDLELSHIYVHADELVYSKLCHILWKNPKLYKQVIVLMGGFHQLRVMQKILYKRYNFRQMQQICVEAEVIAKGSSDQAFEGRHYYRCLRVHKESFDALVQLRVENLTDNHRSTPPELMAKLQTLRKSPSSKSLKDVIECPSFETLYRRVLDFAEGTEEHLSIHYLQDVSLTLALVSAVREGNFERHLQAENKMVSLCYGLDHPNYARYGTYQHVYLRLLEAVNKKAYDELVVKGFGASQTGDPFSSVHGDLITEYFNRTTKGVSGPFRCGYSTNLDTVNRWVKTIHIHSKLKDEFRKVLRIKTSSKHKELTAGGKKIHQKHVSSIKARIQQLGIDPFAKGPPVSFSNGVEIQSDIVKDMLRAEEVGKMAKMKFIKERLVDGSKSFFEPIHQNNLKTGIKKKKKKQPATEVLKEEKQAFGVLVGKAISNKEAFSYPLTSLPLSIATCEGKLYQGDKHDLRNVLMNDSFSKTTIVPNNCAWLVDGMALIRKMKSAETYRHFTNSLIGYISSITENHGPKVVGLINDVYLAESTKESTRRGRGEAGANVRITSIDQKMLTGMRYKEFLHNSRNKESLISIIAGHLQTKDMKLPFPMIVNDKFKTVFIDSEVSQMPDCNHEEADYRIVYHALSCKENVVVVAKDTDILVLLVWAYVHFNVKYKWYFSFEKHEFSDVSVICDHYGVEVCENLLRFHAITGCDTASYMYRVTKVNVFNKIVQNPGKCHLLHALENNEPLCETDISDLKRFVQTVMYPGKQSESYIETRVRLYEQQQKKNSINLPPDPDSLLQDLKRKQLQLRVWRRLDEAWIEPADPLTYGWTIDNEGVLTPVWFTGKQFPPCLQGGKSKGMSSNISRRGKRVAQKPDEDFADGEMSDKESTKSKRRRKRSPAKDNEIIPEIEIVPSLETIQLEESAKEDDGVIDDESEVTLGEEQLLDEEWDLSELESSGDSGSDNEWTPL